MKSENIITLVAVIMSAVSLVVSSVALSSAKNASSDAKRGIVEMRREVAVKLSRQEEINRLVNQTLKAYERILEEQVKINSRNLESR